MSKRVLSVSLGFSLVFSDTPCNILWRLETGKLEGKPNNRAGDDARQERWLSVEEIAAYLGLNRDPIYKWIERKQMPAHKLGKLWKFKVSEVDDWIRDGKAAGTVFRP